MIKIPERNWLITGLSVTGVILIILAFTTGVPAGGADNYAHFNIARWAFRYPHLFLDHWGKPVFTILFAPFACAGFETLRVVNTLLGLITAWFIWKLAVKMGFKYPWFAAVIAVFSPIYFVMISSGMTEILFSFVLVISIYLFFREKYILSALIISFIFLIRTEGLAFLVLFTAAFILKKQYKAIPFLLVGFIVFSIAGGFYHYHDFLWLINKRPYATGKGPSVYGSGELYYFFEKMPVYLGYIISLLLIAGTLVMAFKWFKTKKLNSEILFSVLLVSGTFWGYFFAHSFLWWKGETSAGLVRVMAGISPLAGIISMYALQLFPEKKNYTLVKKYGLFFISILLAVKAGTFYHRSVSSDLTADVYKKVTLWLKESGSLKYKLVMHNPYFAFSTGIDPWNLDLVQYGFSNNENPEAGLPDSTIFIWDAHFSANEGRLPIENILTNPNFEVIRYFEPVVPFKVLGNNEYKIVVFRINTLSASDNKHLLERIKNENFEKGTIFKDTMNFETPFQNKETELFRIQMPESGGFAFNLGNAEFSPSFDIKTEYLNTINVNHFRVSAEFYNNSTLNENRFLMVFSVEKDQKHELYITKDIGEQLRGNSVWEKTGFIFTLPEKFRCNNCIIKIYVWNIDKKQVIMDNFTLEISTSTY
jgi:hypothetical protein